MDGTIADLYGADRWLTRMHAEETGLFSSLKPMITQERLLREFPDSEIFVVSMTPPDVSESYKRVVEHEKREWIRRYFPCINYVVILPWTDNKNIYNLLGHDPKDVLLVDDYGKFRNSFDGDATKPYWI
ncbi:MAG: hypothetical protein IIZ78_06035 [Clostridiales bacterium]|nr:hypothetical protein [Clostridiales bacterium]